MEKEDLLAPENYSIVMELKKFASDPDRKAFMYQDDQGTQRK